MNTEYYTEEFPEQNEADAAGELASGASGFLCLRLELSFVRRRHSDCGIYPAGHGP